MQSPSIWPTTLDPIKEGAMTVIQQALPEEVAMTIRDEALTRQRDRPRFDVAPERQVWVWTTTGAARASEFGRWRSWPTSVAARVGRSVMAHVFSRRPSNRCPKSIVPVVLAAVGEPSGVSDARSLSEPSGRLWRADAPQQFLNAPIALTAHFSPRPVSRVLSTCLPGERDRQNGLALSRSSSCRSSVLPASDNNVQLRIRCRPAGGNDFPRLASDLVPIQTGAGGGTLAELGGTIMRDSTEAALAGFWRRW